MQSTLIFIVTAMVIFWAVVIPTLVSCSTFDGWFAKLSGGAFATLAIGLAVLGFALGGVGLYSNVAMLVMDFGGALWDDGYRLTCLAMTGAYWASFIAAGMTAIGICAVATIEATRELISTITGRPRELVVG